MAKGKITLQNLAEMMAANTGRSKTAAEQFTRHLFATIKHALATDNIIKIKGFGTFKMVIVNARESVNVNTGKRVSIAEHNKITFSPDKTLKERINRPFAQFDTIVVEEDDIEIIENNPNIPAVSPTNTDTTASSTDKTLEFIDKTLEKLKTSQIPTGPSEPVADVVDFLEDTPQQTSEQTETTSSIPPVDNTLEPDLPITQEERQKTPEEETTTVNENIEIPIKEEAGIKEDETKEEEINEKANSDSPSADSISTESQNIETADTEDTTEQSPDKPGRTKRTWLWILGSVVLAAVIAYTLGYLRIIDLNIFGNNQPVAQQDSIKTSPAAKDSVATPVDSASAAILRQAAKYSQMSENSPLYIVGTKTYRKIKPDYNVNRWCMQIYGTKEAVPYVLWFNNITDPATIQIGQILSFPELKENPNYTPTE